MVISSIGLSFRKDADTTTSIWKKKSESLITQWVSSVEDSLHIWIVFTGYKETLTYHKDHMVSKLLPRLS